MVYKTNLILSSGFIILISRNESKVNVLTVYLRDIRTCLYFYFPVEELECLATWKDGSTRYLVGKLYHKMATSDEDRYRCFVYDQQHQHSHHQVYQVAQSGDATCNGLPSALEGSRTMKLTTSMLLVLCLTLLQPLNQSVLNDGVT